VILMSVWGQSLFIVRNGPLTKVAMLRNDLPTNNHARSLSRDQLKPLYEPRRALRSAEMRNISVDQDTSGT
jgi:hypothetical protein